MTIMYHNSVDCCQGNTRLLDLKVLVGKQMQAKLKQAMLIPPVKERWDEAYMILC